MPKHPKALLLAAITLAAAWPSAAQCPMAVAPLNSTGVDSVAGNNTPDDLVRTIVGGGITIGNIQFKGSRVAAGTFTNGQSALGFDSGIVLSSGNVSNVLGPNTYTNISTSLGQPPDADLSALVAGRPTFDATVLEFDFVPERDMISFQYVFASEEYNEYANTLFNDVFGFFLNGTNAALLESSDTGDFVVSINNINGGNPLGVNPRNPQYYRNNDDGSICTEMDGLTVVLSVHAAVVAHATNHIKLAIADVFDHSYDSAVFIKAGSFSANRPPSVTCPPSDAVFGACSNLTLTARVEDADGDALTAVWSLNGLTVATNQVPAQKSSFSATISLTQVFPLGSNTVTLLVFDGTTTTNCTTTFLAVDTTPPTLGEIVGPDPVALGSPVSLKAAASDNCVLSSAGWKWGDGSTSPGMMSGGYVSGSHTYTNAGVYTVTLTVTDQSSNATQGVFTFAVVYDPTDGFVTGGGWINSPTGAYSPEPSLTGKASFGFVSKYRRGAVAPTGQTEFQFRVASLNFHSSIYDWLVVAGARAQYMGSGTINGGGDYGFLLTATDGQVTGGGGVDKFRMKIWNKATNATVYDNQMGAADNADASQALAGGSIVIHSQ